MQFLRSHFDREDVLICAATAASKNGACVKTAGIVLVRQRPGKGNAIFATIEDESGITNVVIWARLFEHYRRAVQAEHPPTQGVCALSRNHAIFIEGLLRLSWQPPKMR